MIELEDRERECERLAQYFKERELAHMEVPPKGVVLELTPQRAIPTFVLYENEITALRDQGARYVCRLKRRADGKWIADTLYFLTGDRREVARTLDITSGFLFHARRREWDPGVFNTWDGVYYCAKQLPDHGPVHLFPHTD